MNLIIEVHENENIGCDTREHYDSKKEQLEKVFKANGHNIITDYIEDAEKDMLVILTPNGERTEIYAYNLHKLNTTLFNIVGIEVI